MVAKAHIALSSRLDPYEGVGQSISCVRCGPHPESGAFNVAPISPRKLSRRLNAIRARNFISSSESIGLKFFTLKYY
jgi:hypothetical protein